MLSTLQIKDQKRAIYSAGLPHFHSNFTRDSIISGILLNDEGFLKNQLEYCKDWQGKKNDPLTGEEPGKIHHEMPGMMLRDLNSAYNGCDTTAWYILGHEYLYNFTSNSDLLEEHNLELHHALQYILNHLDDGLFMEGPKFCGAERFALRVTYWKDSSLVDRPGDEPVYPICYTLAHVQNLAAVRFLASYWESKDLENTYKLMLRKLKEVLFSMEKNQFCLAKDEQGYIYAQNSDFLQLLFYLNPNELEEVYVNSIVESGHMLETPIGFRTLEKSFEGKVEDYHSKTVWPFEQALIHQGANKFKLSYIQEIAQRVCNVLDTDHELVSVDVETGKFEKIGCDPQLWTIGAKEYFKREGVL